MKQLLTSLLFAIPLFAGDTANILVYSSIDIDKLVEKLAKPFDLDRTIRTIIKMESEDGKYLVNLTSGDCGITHINIDTYMNRHKIKNTPFNRNKACMELINNPPLAIANAVEELLYWQEVHCRKVCSKVGYKNVIKSYNAGWNYNSKKAEQYWSKFKQTYRSIYGK